MTFSINVPDPKYLLFIICFICTGWQICSKGDSIHAPQDVIQRSAMSPPEQSSTDARLYLPVNHFHEYSNSPPPTHSAWSEFISPGHLSLPKMLMVESFEVILQRYFISEPVDNGNGDAVETQRHTIRKYFCTVKSSYLHEKKPRATVTALNVLPHFTTAPQFSRRDTSLHVNRVCRVRVQFKSKHNYTAWKKNLHVYTHATTPELHTANKHKNGKHC